MEFTLADGSTIVVDPDTLVSDSDLITRFERKDTIQDTMNLTMFDPQITRQAVEFMQTGECPSDPDPDFYMCLDYYNALEFNFLRMGYVPTDFPSEWLVSAQEEEYMRNRFYKTGFEDLQLDQYYKLIWIDDSALSLLNPALNLPGEIEANNEARYDISQMHAESILRSRNTNRSRNDGSKHFTIDDWKQHFHFFTEGEFNNCVIAGGSLSSSLMGEGVSDYDIFIYGVSEEDANLKVISILNKLNSKESRITRSENSITFKDSYSRKIQII
jgi:hypothetical protein